MYEQHIKDDGSIIGYDPVLSYTKDMKEPYATAEGKIPGGNSNETAHGNNALSRTLQGFTESLPSKTLQELSGISARVPELTDMLAHMFNTGRWEQYNEVSMLITAINNGDTGYAKDFVQYHYSSITGSIIPELIFDICEAGERIKIISGTLKKLYYGAEDIEPGQASAIDNKYVEMLSSFEASGDTAKINYPALAHDAMVNYSTLLHAYDINKYIARKASVADMHNSASIPAAMLASVSAMFNETNEELSYRKNAYAARQDKALLRSALYNYYAHRRTVLDMLELSYRCPSVPFGRKLLSGYNTLSESIKELNRVYTGNSVYMQETLHLQQEKNYLKNIYNATSYK